MTELPLLLNLQYIKTGKCGHNEEAKLRDLLLFFCFVQGEFLFLIKNIILGGWNESVHKLW